MTIPKEQILDLLRQRGQHDQVPQADGQLPDQVDPEAHGGLLSQFGLDPMELLSMFAGGGAGGGLRDLAAEYGVSHEMIRGIVRRGDQADLVDATP